MKFVEKSSSRFIVYAIIIFAMVLMIRYYIYGASNAITEGEKAYNESVIESLELSEDAPQMSDDEKLVLAFVNQEREKNGLENLEPIVELQEVAKIKANDIVENKYFAHNSPTLGTPFELLKSYNITYKIAGENLAGNITSRKAVEAWMNSPSHKENILEEKYKYTGIAVVNSEKYGKVFVQFFLGF